MKELQAFEASMDFDEIVAFRRIGLRAYQEARKTQGLVGGLMGALFFREERGAVVGGARHPQAPCDTTTSDTSAGKASPSAWDSRPLRMLATAFSGVWPAARAQSR